MKVNYVLHFQLFTVYIQLERQALLALCYWSEGTELVVLAFQLLLDCDIFKTTAYFLDGFFAWLSPVSLTLLPFPTNPPPPHLLQTRRNDHFIFLQTTRSTIPRSWLKQKVRAALWSERLCTEWRFSVMETLAVILTCRWQVKRLKVPGKKKNNKNGETK